MRLNWFDSELFIVAEAGVNHNGKLRTAMKLVDAAKAAGCDAVKFQTYRSEQLATKRSMLAPYQRSNGKQKIKSQFDLIKKFELGFEDFRALKKYCDKQKITFLSTPFDEECVDFLDKLEVPFFKVSSGDVTNLPLLRYMAGKGNGIVLSTGMSTLAEVKEAVYSIRRAGCERLMLLHCVTEYPAPEAEVNLRAMVTLKNTFRVPVGYSDHTIGMEVAIAAVALGATMIEKHLTLDRQMAGPDHRASLDPKDFTRLVHYLRNVQSALGSGLKKPSECEKKNIAVARRSLIAIEPISKGERIERRHLAIKRPGYGIQPKEFEKVIGLQARRDIQQDSVICWEHLV